VVSDQTMKQAARVAVSTAVALAILALAACDLGTSAAVRVQRARAALAAGDFRRASIELKTVLESHPNDGEARLALAEASFASGDLAAAFKELDRAVALGVTPDRTEPLRWQYELAGGQAAHVAETLSKPRPGLGEGLRTRLLARALVETDRPAEAVERLQAAPQLDGENRLVLAEALARLGHTDEALKALEPVIQDTALAARAYAARGDVLLRAGRIDDGLAALETAVSRSDPVHDRAAFLGAESVLVNLQLSLGKIEAARTGLKRLQDSAPTALSVRVTAGRLALAERRFAAASDDFSQIVRAMPDNTRVRGLLAVALMEQGAVGQAESQLDEILQREPANAVARRMLADLQLRAGRPEAAQATLARLEPQSSPDGATLLIVARAALASGDRESALRALERAGSVASTDPALRLELAGAYLQAGSPDRALGLLDARPATGARAHREALLHVLALAGSKKTDIARAEAERYATDHPQDPAAQNVAGLYFVVARQPDLARPYFEAALKLAPADVEALGSLAQLEVSERHFDAAESLLKRWLAARPDATPARMGLAQVALMKGDGATARRWLEQARTADPKAIEPRLALARADAADGGSDAARLVVNEALALDPKRLVTLSTAALVEERAGDLGKATDYLRRAVQIAPTAVDIRTDLGRVLLAGGDVPGARAAFSQALEMRPGYWPAVEGLARSLERAGDHEGVAALLQDLKAKPSNRITGWVLDGNLAAARGDYAAAVASYNRALDLEANPSIAVQRYRAQVAGHLPDAEVDLRAWIGRRPTDDSVRMALAEHLEGRGDSRGAIAEYEKVAARRPRDAIVLNNLAWAYHLGGDPRATETARAAVQLAPQVPAILDTLGWILVGSGALPEGLENLRRAAGASRTQPDIQYHYAVALSRTGQTVEALRTLDAALAAKGPFPGRDEAQRLRDQLKTTGGG